jgi:hypothetical protein
MGTPFHQHFFDVTPLLEQKLVLDHFRVIRECKHAGKALHIRTNPGEEGRSDQVVMVGQFSRNLAATGAWLVVHINGVVPR